ncbi:hypothetical protein [Corynebacterium liangguodongii]|uniref:Uncharacterized protein n=1 Tax=Corynebacterium liangguodongii TaxID=2079535 RepID=A0A2S0WF89_9CORY|nr:hypothetical protein [Corynebacterium liangguodongii]AWB84453.1 hypothetical protein C3E79_08125 [Corynebacterium liangguodongii]PWB99942.1 hypothetical protein DF219_04720 [Corynebacterium liangguodongii]
MSDTTSILTQVNPTPEGVLADSSTFSPRRWKSGWPHHLSHVPPFRDDPTATITRGEVFAFAADAVESGLERNALIDFIGAAFAYAAGQSPQTQLSLQQFLRNKARASELFRALRTLEGKDPAAQYDTVHATGLPARFASALVYFLAGPQTGEDTKPQLLSDTAARSLGVSAEDYPGYLDALTAARDAWDPAAPVDCVELALTRG